jgi:hypothetical protein
MSDRLGPLPDPGRFPYSPMQICAHAARPA